MCGRNSIFIHGCQCCTTADDSVPPPSGCSAGCVIISYANRKKIRVGDTLIVQHIEPKLTYDSEWKWLLMDNSSKANNLQYKKIVFS